MGYYMTIAMKFFRLLYIFSFLFLIKSPPCFSYDHTAAILLVKVKSGRITPELNSLASKYLFLNTDSSILYAQRALILALKSENKKMEGDAYYLLGGNYWITGNYPKALTSILQSLHLYEKLNSTENIENSYRALASIYRDKADFKNALFYANKCKSIVGRSGLTAAYTVIGSIYEKFDKLDSAKIYLELAQKADVLYNGREYYGYISLILGNLYHKRTDFQSAIKFYKKGIRLIESQKVYKDLIEGYNGIASVYKDMMQLDSSIVYSKKALTIGKATPFLLGMLESSSMLSKIYLGRNNLDSTVKYMALILTIKDTLYNQQKTREFQNLVFKEQLREQEIEESKVRAEEQRKQNIQLLATAAFIPLFFVAVLILWRRKINPRIIQFMVLIGLLLFFEFISLLIHPLLELWTHHTPILMLLALVVIASILVPSHHGLEKWLKTRLTASTNILHHEEMKAEDNNTAMK
ncbi:MAG: Tetratricopeptide repeat-containing protein [Mucilaginibacter sp.]|nr:Tetratricopeptide repeat-containing protein [Mucilaginibacter sp.]